MDLSPVWPSNPPTTAPPASTSPSSAPPPGCVQVPDTLPTDPAYITWIVLAWMAGDDDWATPRQDTLAAHLGRPATAVATVRRLIKPVEAAGWLKVRRVHRRSSGKTVNEYAPMGRARRGDGQRYVEIPATMMVALQTGQVRPEHVMTAVRWMRECRRRGGWSPRSLTELGAEWGQSEDTLRRHRRELIALGVLDGRNRHGQSALTALPGKLPPVPVAAADPAGDVAATVTTVLPAPVDPPARMSGHPPHERAVTPRTDERPNYLEENYLEENYPVSVPVGTESPGRNARAYANAAPPRAGKNMIQPVRPRRRAPSPQAWQVLAALPRTWWTCPHWVRRRLAESIDTALRQFGSQAIVAAVTRYAPDPTADANDGGALAGPARHTWTLTRVLRLLTADVKAGACVDCGHDHCDLGGTSSCHCCARHRPPGPAWTEDESPGACVACGGSCATVRSELPLESLVCDDCWTRVALAA